MKKKIILDLCGGTASWSKPYSDAGYTVYNITLPEFDVTAWCEAEMETTDGRWIPAIGFGLPVGDDNCAPDVKLMVALEDIHGILAAPPCTMFSLARTRAKTPRDFAEGLRVVRACLDIVNYCRSKGNLQWWALENPTGYLRQFLGNPPLRFEHWQYGDNGVKPTDIWGYFNAPTKRTKKRGLFVRGFEDTKINSRYGHKKAAEIKAMTPPGFANAFFKANQ